MLQRERDTGVVHWPPKPAYWKGGKLEWFAASGRGEIYSYVVGYEPFLPAFRELLPHIMVLVQLDEGPRLVGYMVNCRPEEMAFGMKVRVVFKRADRYGDAAGVGTGPMRNEVAESTVGQARATAIWRFRLSTWRIRPCHSIRKRRRCSTR